VEGPKIEFVVYAKPLRMHKVNIGTEEKPKFTNIGDYWNEETIEKIDDYCASIKTYFQLHFYR
jgi:hypothetical protein